MRRKTPQRRRAVNRLLTIAKVMVTLVPPVVALVKLVYRLLDPTSLI